MERSDPKISVSETPSSGYATIPIYLLLSKEYQRMIMMRVCVCAKWSPEENKHLLVWVGDATVLDFLIFLQDFQLLGNGNAIAFPPLSLRLPLDDIAAIIPADTATGRSTAMALRIIYTLYCTCIYVYIYTYISIYIYISIVSAF